MLCVCACLSEQPKWYQSAAVLPQELGNQFCTCSLQFLSGTAFGSDGQITSTGSNFGLKLGLSAEDAKLTQELIFS